MRRLHLIEIHDQEWCPRSLRDGLTRVLSFGIFCLRSYKPAADLLGAAITKTGDKHVIDLCAGNGGPWNKLLGRVRQRVPESSAGLTVSFTDKFPNENPPVLPDGLNYVTESVDAMDMPKDLKGFRTLFTSFHHFEPQQAEAILADAVKNGAGIAVFEFTRRHPIALIPYLLVPLFVWLSTPFRMPFHWKDWAWTFPIPVLPLVVFFDGVVSCFRTYSPAQCLELAAAADPKSEFDWESGVKWSMPGGMTYLVGTPKQPATGDKTESTTESD